jgi:hypothetical protein
MYNLERDKEQLVISFSGKPVTGGIRPSLALDDGSLVRPSLTASETVTGEDRLGAYTEHRFGYWDEDETLNLTLTFRLYGATLVASMAVAALKGNGIGVRAKGLAPVGGVTLHVAGLGEVEGLMANYLHKDWWTRPHFDVDLAALPPRTQSLVWRAGDVYHHLLCVAGDVFKAEIAGEASGGLALAVAAYDGGYTNVETVAFTLSGGDDPFPLPALNVETGMQARGTPFQTRFDKRYPEPFEYLGWCSWDAFYHDVSAEGVLDKARELWDKEVPVRWMIVDDGWMRHEDRHLTAFAPDPEKFPGGFAPLADALKQQYGIAWLGIWHTLFGYWNGVLPGGDLARTMGDALVTTHTGKVIPAAEVSRAFTFWDAWHTDLRRAGVDFVKVDYQSGLATYWAQALGIGTAAQRAHAALEASVGKNFDNVVINCMGMATENLWHRPTSAVTRNSDDFFPNKTESFVEHALQNAYNAYYHAPFMWLDWDMWWTRHEHAATHAVLRAVSGGPVYVSDRVGETDPAQLRPLALSDGRLLRCDEPGRVTEDCLLLDPSRAGVPLKVWNRVGEVGVVGAFNVSADETPVTGTAGPADVPGLAGERFVVYEHVSRRAQVVAMGDRVDVTLAPGESALYLIAPQSSPVTPIGLVDKYIAPAAMADWSATPDRTLVLLLEGGRFAWAAEAAPEAVFVNGERVEVEAGAGVFTVDCCEIRGPVWIELR